MNTSAAAMYDAKINASSLLFFLTIMFKIKAPMIKTQNNFKTLDPLRNVAINPKRIWIPININLFLRINFIKLLVI